MGVLKPADFYYGAFLSALLNYADKKPSLFDPSPSRRIYRLTTEHSIQDYMIYTKYVNVRENKSDDFGHWIFSFSADEIQKMIDLDKQGFTVKFALICAKKDLKDCELALVDYEDVMDCIGLSKGIKASTYRINIKAIDGKHGLRMYGSGRSDKIHGRDNTLKVPRDALKDL